MSISRDEFRQALGRFASGVTVITTRGADGFPHGITVSAFCSVSMEPPLILVCIDKRAASHDSFTESDNFVVNILGSEQQHYSDLFASHSGKKFEAVDYAETEERIPFLPDALVNLECRKTDAHASGDHTIFVGEILKSNVRDGEPLVYFHGNYRKLETS